MADIFVSYSRKDIAFAKLLNEALTENGFETWIDWQDIPPSVDWLREVYTAIEEASAFVFILSATSLLSQVCRLEVEHAKKNNKRLIAIAVHDVDQARVHPALSAINWIFSRTSDAFESAIEDLVLAIRTDWEWVRYHTHLQIDALAWANHQQDPAYLYQGARLKKAEQWLSAVLGSTHAGPEHTPDAEKHPGLAVEPSTRRSPALTALQEEFVKASRLARLTATARWYESESDISHYAPDLDLTCVNCGHIHTFTPSERLPFPANCPICGFEGKGRFAR